MQTRYSDEKAARLSVRLSVCLSNACIVTKREERPVQIFIPYERSFSLVFGEEEWLEILGQLAHVGAKSPILNRYSLVAPQP